MRHPPADFRPTPDRHAVGRTSNQREAKAEATAPGVSSPAERLEDRRDDLRVYPLACVVDRNQDTAGLG